MFKITKKGSFLLTKRVSQTQTIIVNIFPITKYPKNEAFWDFFNTVQRPQLNIFGHKQKAVGLGL